LEQIEQLVPGAAKMIIGWADRQGAHRQALENITITHDTRRSWGGLVAGLAVALTQTLGGIWCVLKGHDAAGVAIILGVGVQLVVAFVYGTRMRRQEREGRVVRLTRSQQRRLRR
jgi:hypothetical protein